jgi:FKBP-type peptidyl-prolyl cis-trans isomerase
MMLRSGFFLCCLTVLCVGCRTHSGTDADAFFAENARRPEVKSMASGLQYVVHRQGKGVIPDVTDEVTVHYVGRLLNGDIFDSSYKSGKPVRLAVLKFIPGCVEALRHMPEGSEWTLYIPSELAYGKRDVSSQIRPDTPLLFRMNLIKVHKE